MSREGGGGRAAPGGGGGAARPAAASGHCSAVTAAARAASRCTHTPAHHLEPSPACSAACKALLLGRRGCGTNCWGRDDKTSRPRHAPHPRAFGEPAVGRAVAASPAGSMPATFTVRGRGAARGAVALPASSRPAVFVGFRPAAPLQPRQQARPHPPRPPSTAVLAACRGRRLTRRRRAAATRPCAQPPCPPPPAGSAAAG